MTGRDLIIYILENKLEDEQLFKDGKIIGFLTAAEYAAKMDVGEATVRLWVDLGWLDGIRLYDELYIPTYAKIKDSKGV